MAPFRGVRYAAGRVAGLAEVTSPPYDVIAHDIEDKLIAADPHNIVRLILPRRLAGEGTGQRGGDDFYADAAVALRQWQAGGILTPDAVPGLYVYEQAVLSGGGPGTEPGGAPVVRVLQRGLIGGVGLVPAEDGVILPHEDVVPGPVTGRRELMEATQANLEPIYLIYDGSQPGGGAQGGATGGLAGAASALVESVATGREPLLEASTEDGLRHRLWVVTDPAELAAVAADLAPRSALIADGHHRYAAYLQLQDRRRKAGSGGGPWDYGLALLVDSAAYPPQIGAIHRVIPGLAPAKAVDLVKGSFCVCPLPGGTQDLTGALDALTAAAKDGPAFLLAGGGAVYLLTDPDPLQVDAAMPPGQSARWRGLAASVLQQLLVNTIWGLRDDDRDVRIVHNDAATAILAADRVPGGTAVICAPMTAADVYAIAANGERVPRKSTSFGPKPRTGLVIRTFAES
ncbi:MAG: DUF1015 domain-containing protein [Actinomycetota bacterium]